MPTIVDVARTAAVSTATVSRVLCQPDLVAEDTRLRVQDVIAKLGYLPNKSARSLRTLRVSKILVTVPDMANPFFAEVVSGAEEVARAAGYSIVLGNTHHDPDLENQYASMLESREVDGLIFLGHRLPARLVPLVKAPGSGASVVNGCEYSPDLGVPSVHIDNAKAGADATAHLIDLGHRSLGVITGPMMSPINRDRLNGVLAEIEARGVPINLSVETGDYSVESGAEAAAALLQRGATAIFCFSDEMAVGALGAVRDAGLRCPDDVSVMGFDDIRIAAYLQPPLTTIAQPKADIGRFAARTLLDILENGVAKQDTITLDHQLIRRQSTGPVRQG